MRRFIKIVLICALLSWAAIGLRHAQGHRGQESRLGGAVVAASSRPHKDIVVDTGDGPFILKNLRLTRMTGSTVLKGDIVNKTNRQHEQVTFEVRAYDRNGQLLKGLEDKTIFAARQLQAAASTPLNHGFGVWLQGIPLDSIVRLEVLEARDETASFPSWTKWFASHAVMREKYAEIEE